jgi:hypothetical protein
MRGIIRPMVGAFGLLTCAVLAAAGDDADERALRAANVGTDGPALLRFFQDRTAGDADRDRIAALIADLGNDSYDRRERASADLVAVGARAEPLLRDAAKNHRDAEIKRRAGECLRRLARESDPAVLAAAARVLAARRPDGAAEALLAFLPGADDETVADEVRAALAAVAVKDGKAAPALVKALGDKLPVKRAAAAAALCRAGARDHFPEVRKLLKDAEPAVRLSAALALAEACDRQAVPVLIELLADLPPKLGVDAEESLFYLAGQESPRAPLGESGESRRAARDAWAAWWKKSGDKADLARLAEARRGLGYTLIVHRDTANGWVTEYDRDGKVRWEITGLDSPRDAQVLPNGNVLVCENGEGRLTERTTRGEVVWEKTLPGPGRLMAAQRLPNGNTFIVTHTGLTEIDRDGKEVFSRAIRGCVYSARKLRTGEVAYVTVAGGCTLLDRGGQEVATFDLGYNGVSGAIDLLPNGNVVVTPLHGQNKVGELDASGKEVWSAAVDRPSSATRLANGNVLVCRSTARQVVELDRDGKEVWKMTLKGRPVRASRR